MAVLFGSILLNPAAPPPRSLHLSLWHPAGNITPHSTQMGSPRTSYAHVQSCMQIYARALHAHTSTITSAPPHTHTHILRSNPGHQLQRESQVISISLIALYHISTCSPFSHNLSSSPHKTYTYRPLNNPPPIPSHTIMTTVSLHLQSIHGMKAASNGFFCLPTP